VVALCVLLLRALQARWPIAARKAG